MVEVLIRNVYSAFVAYSRCSVALVATANQRHAWRTEISSYTVC